MDPVWPDVRTFAWRPRDALMWLPRALDVARIVAAARASAASHGAGVAAGRAPRVVDVGAGTGLLARLLSNAGVPVVAVDPAPALTRYQSVERADASTLTACDVAIVSWMEAGKDYREAVARAAPVIVNVYDVEGGCGVMGAVDFAPFGHERVASWRTPSFEDAQFVLERPGRGLQRKGHPGNRVDILTREAALTEHLRAAIENTAPGPALPWEHEMDEVGL